MSTVVAEVNRLSARVLEFSTLMIIRAVQTAVKGYTGWEDQEYNDLMWKKLDKHVELAREGKVDSYVDIANLAMFLHGLKTERMEA